MNFFPRLFRRSRAAASYEGPRTGAVTLTLAGENEALCVAAVYGCVRVLADSVATLELQHLRRRRGLLAADSGSRMHYLFNVQPEPSCSAFDFWRNVVQHILLAGNAYIVPVYDSEMQPERMVLCPRGSVSHDIYSDRYTINHPYGGVVGTYAEHEVLHIKGRTLRNDKSGCSVLEYARRASSISAAGDRETLDRFSNGGAVRGILSNDRPGGGFGQYKAKELDAQARNFDERLRAGERILATPADVKFSQLTLTSADMQFLESRKFNVPDICRFFGVPPSYVFADTGSNYKSVEQSATDFLNRALNPLLRAIEGELQRKLVAPTRHGCVRFEFDRRGVLACDPAGRAKLQAQRLANGTATINELRAEDNMPPLPGGDTLLVTANLTAAAAINSDSTSDTDND